MPLAAEDPFLSNPLDSPSSSPSAALPLSSSSPSSSVDPLLDPLQSARGQARQLVEERRERFNPLDLGSQLLTRSHHVLPPSLPPAVDSSPFEKVNDRMTQSDDIKGDGRRGMGIDELRITPAVGGRGIGGGAGAQNMLGLNQSFMQYVSL